MIVEVLIDGIPTYRWPINENEGISGGFSWENKVKYRETAINKVIQQIEKEILPHLKDRGKLEIYTVFESKFPEAEADEAKPAYKSRPIILKTPPPGPTALQKVMSIYTRPEQETFIRPKAEYSNRQHISNY